MRRSLALICFLGMSFFALTQNTQPYELIPYRKDTLWGFADISKTMLISPQYDEIRFFRDEITAVRMGRKWAFINKYGKTVTAYKYDLAGDFKEGMCQVRSGDKVGYVNNKGKEIVKPAYDYGYEYSEGLAVVSDELNGELLSKVIDKNGRVIMQGIHAVSGQFHSGYLAIREGDQPYFLDRSGRKLRLPENAEIYFEFSEDAAIVKLPSIRSSSGTTDTVVYLGIMNTGGKIRSDTVRDVFGFKFSVAGTQRIIANFVNGFAIVQRPTTSQNFAAYNNSYEYAFLDKNGKLSMWFSSVRAFSAEGTSLVVAASDSVVRIIDRQFKTITTTIPIVDAGTFSEGMLRVKFADSGKWGYMNERGEVVLYPVYEDCTDFSGGVAIVTLNGRKGCINKNGLQFWDK